MAFKSISGVVSAADTGIYHPTGQIYVNEDGVRLCPGCGEEDPQHEHDSGSASEMGRHLTCNNQPRWFEGFRGRGTKIVDGD